MRLVANRLGRPSCIPSTLLFGATPDRGAGGRDPSHQRRSVEERSAVRIPGRVEGTPRKKGKGREVRDPSRTKGGTTVGWGKTGEERADLARPRRAMDGERRRCGSPFETVGRNLGWMDPVRQHVGSGFVHQTHVRSTNPRDASHASSHVHGTSPSRLQPWRSQPRSSSSSSDASFDRTVHLARTLQIGRWRTHDPCPDSRDRPVARGHPPRASFPSSPLLGQSSVPFSSPDRVARGGTLPPRPPSSELVT